MSKKLKEILFHLKKSRFELIFSHETYSEFLFVLRRPKFSPYFSASDILEFIELLKVHSRFVSPVILLTKWFSDLEELDPPLNPIAVRLRF
jgi:predicted nucleic acid-binding protein